MKRKSPAIDLPPGKLLLLLAAILAVTLPHAAHIPVWVTLLLISISAWKLLISFARLRAPGRLLRMLIVACSLVGVFLAYRTLLGRDAGVALLVIMTGLKLLELDTRRDVVVLIYLGIFLIITNFLYSQSILMAAWMLVSVWLLMASMIALNHARKAVTLRAYARQSLGHMLLALPFTLVLFVLFPRIEGPLWNLPRDAHGGISGLGDSMAPGNISRLARSDRVAFRVTFDGPPPPGRLLYWRGPVLDRFDGSRWSQSYLARTGKQQSDYLSREVRYSMILEPHNRNWVFALDMPGPAPAGTRINFHHQLLAIRTIRKRQRYHLRSWLRYRIDPDMHDQLRHYFLRVPAYRNPRSVALALDMRRRHADDSALIRAWLDFFRNRNFHYTLSPGRYGYDAIDEFLFERRRGFCEHYASAFAFVMRVSGIPSRIVTGYQGGEMNRIGNYMIVRQSDAHAWVEVWLQGRGWVRVDPTSAVAPQRIESGLEAALPARELAGRPARSRSHWLRNLGLLWDSINNGWNEWVLAFNSQTQEDLLARLGIDPMRDAELLLWLTAIVLSLLGVIFVILHWPRHRQGCDPAKKLYLACCRKLARKGIERRPAEGPLALCERVCHLRPELGPSLCAFINHYVRLRYGKGGQDEIRKMKRLLQQL